MTPRAILSQYWGHESFRPMQEEIVQSVLDGKHTLALLPTGGGKSICFQVPAMMFDGVCIVVSPLIALMRDQVEQLQSRQIKATALYSGMTRREIDITLDNCVYDNVKFLYVSPERLRSSLFLARAERMNVSMLAVDEAHCISQWGYDFRPSYLHIHDFVERRGIDRLIALTATATKRVKEDIVEKLKLVDTQIFTRSFARTNLSYSVFNLENKERKLAEVLTNVPGSSIVYVRSRKMAEVVGRTLRAKGQSTDYYHAGLSATDRERKQDLWRSGKLRVMVATNAFGMGIDKSDVRSVIHLDLPDSLEAYYQEAGRAGRDEQKAYAVLLYDASDVIRLKDQLVRNAVSLASIRRVYQALANYYKLAVGSLPEKSFAFELERFASTYDLSALETFNCMKKLQEAGVLTLSESFFKSSQVMILQRKEDLYRFQVAHPKLDLVIKSLLRLYGGQIFQEFVSIKEGDLAKVLKVSSKQVSDWLDMLVQFEVADYVKRNSA
ncbi:MAG: ATP-dependent DNA helicase RecQ, partial [Bacteroidota bacterium]